MKFDLVDKIEQLSDTRIVAVKQVSLAEEYLADHFPTFPVLPGVMMLEAMTQAAAWLLHRRQGFASALVVLREARNVKYGNFVAPGDVLRIEVEYLRETASGFTFKAVGSVGGADGAAVTARLELSCLNLADRHPELAAVDQRLREHNRRRWDLIAPAAADGAVGI